ncbi:MAG: hypothetical protein WC475_01695 [Candidatus Paceibacterota bacterium]|jgi:hypothetical protein
MVEREDLIDTIATGFNRFMCDDFGNLDSLIFTKTGTAIETAGIMNLKLSSGLLSASSIKARYNLNIFNITLARAFFHLQFSDTENIQAFFGFKETSEDPIFGASGGMVEYHVGVMIEPDITNALNGPKVYFSTGDGTAQQKVEILGIDATRDYIYKIAGNKLYTMPLPEVVPYFGSFQILDANRIWTLKQENSGALPFDTSYYCMFYLKNLTNEEKNVRIKALTYGEDYAD